MRWLLIFFFANGLYADGLLETLDFENGEWEMAAVSLHNYKPLPIQKQLGTFFLRDQASLKKMQATWYFPPFYEDNCDYHYALKFYKNKKLQKTLLINLECNYISEGLFSYRFEPDRLLLFEDRFEKVPWSFINFRDLPTMRRVIDKVKLHPEYYFYDDFSPYLYDGRFVVKTTNMDWDDDIDSIRNMLAEYISYHSGSSDFFIQSTMLFVDDQGKFTYRHDVYCNKDLADSYLTKDTRNLISPWKGHFDLLYARDKYLTLVVVGINKARYRQLMRE